jgi:hypothetical protein
MVSFSLNAIFSFSDSASSLLIYILMDTGLYFLKLLYILGINIYSLFLYKSISDISTYRYLKPGSNISRSMELIFLRIYYKFNRGLTC